MPEFDIVLYGATGFTGRQAARTLAERAPASLRWAVAGRNAEKLEAIAQEVGASGAIVADSAHPDSIRDMAQKTRVLATTAGPFSRLGTPIVKACVENEVDYVDITGETPWVHDLIDSYHERASRSGTRIVPMCGFDSVPSDLGALWVARHLRREHGEGTRRVSASYRLRGGLNGGTLATMLSMAENAELRRAVADPLLLNPPSARDGDSAPPDRRRASFDGDRQAWLTPFFMAPINTRVVRRSAALFADYGAPYGDAFCYEEALETSRRGKAYAVAALSGAMFSAAKTRAGRAALAKLGPAPGQGPSPKTMERGFFAARFVGESDRGRKVMATLSCRGDPANYVTVTILCEAALLLAQTPRNDLPGGSGRGGLLTPATGLGLPLLDRLRAAGFETDIDAPKT